MQMKCGAKKQVRWFSLAAACGLALLAACGHQGAHGLGSSAGNGDSALPAVNLDGFSLPQMAETVPPVPTDLRAVRERLAPYQTSMANTREASGVVKTLPDSSV